MAENSGKEKKKREIHIGNLTLGPGKYIEALVQGRKYRVRIEEIDEYNTIIGRDNNGKDVMIRLSKIVAMRTMTEDEFYGREQ